LISLTDKWLQALDQCTLIGSVLVLFKKAFDMVNLKILLKVLNIYQYDQKTVRLFASYVSEKTQHVSMNHVLFEPITIRCGVPQAQLYVHY
jgi:hypothetical protein